MGGHNIDEFGKLLNVQLQEEINIQTKYGKFKYLIIQKRVANKTDPMIAKELSQRENSRLILYTCYPIDNIGLTDKRLFITANLISGPIINENN